MAITGASGSIYARSLLRNIVPHYETVYVIVSDTASIIMRDELGTDDVRKVVGMAEKLTVLDNTDMSAPPSSGSHQYDGMVVVPCSMGAVGRIAAGVSQDLISRVADVCLKERRRLVLVPRETPLSAIHLENLLKLSRAGAVVLPASPPFYNKPQTIDDLVNAVTARILSHLGIEQDLVKEWKE
ncbi:MAG: UbiX family flavin prenyltransferase [Armatimonadota bacterium]|nr:UbiX family flavin prenyltransferase [Armatimonadota bacterium]